MKKFIMVVSILIATVSYAQVPRTQQTIALDGLAPSTWSSIGCYYKGVTYIFYPGTSSAPVSFGTTIDYSKIYINDGDLLNLVPDSTKSSSTKYEFPFTLMSFYVIPTACVFNGKLYLFYAKANHQIMYTSTDGSTWTEPVSVYSYKAEGISISASVLGDRLYLAFQDNNNKNVKMIYSNDLQNWNSAGQIISANDMSNNNASISTCTFATSNNSSHLLIAVNYNNAWIYTTWYDKKNGYHKSQKLLVSTNGKSVNLVKGSLNYLYMTNANASIQLLFRGTNNMLWIMQYSPDDNNWGSPLNTGYLTEMDFSPGVFTLFRSVNEKKLVKRICAVEAATNDMGIYILNSCVFNSDIIKNTETISNTCDTIPSLWSLVGVVEGPPPFVLNGRNLADLNANGTPPSEFTYGTSESEEVVNSSEWTVSTSVSVSVPFADIFSAGIDIKTAVNGLVSTSYEQTYNEFHSVLPVDSAALGYYYFIKPTITRYKYERFNYNNESTNQYEYVFAVTDATLKPVTFELQDFDPLNIESYKNKAPDPAYKTLLVKGLSWTVGSPLNFEFSSSTSTENTQGASVEISANVGAEDFFKVSAGYSIDIKETHKTTFGKSVGIQLNNPDPRPGHPEDVSSYDVTMYWLKSTSQNDYWIPKDLYGHDYSDQRPWLVTWSTSGIQYNSPTDVKTDPNLPKKFSLSQNYPNPFNPTTTIKYSIPVDLSSSPNEGRSTKLVTLKVYNMLGQAVKTLVNEEKSPGNYSVQLNAADLASGIYIYRLQSGSFISTKKLILIK